MNNLIHQITPENFMGEVVSERKPWLLLCMPKDDDFPSQLKTVEATAEHHKSWLNVGIMGDAFLEYFKKKLNVTGTPTFLFFFDGKETNRILGLTDHKNLEEFLHEFMKKTAEGPF